MDALLVGCGSPTHTDYIFDDLPHVYNLTIITLFQRLEIIMVHKKNSSTTFLKRKLHQNPTSTC